jgi:hypothetical protein
MSTLFERSNVDSVHTVCPLGCPAHNAHARSVCQIPTNAATQSLVKHLRDGIWERIQEDSPQEGIRVPIWKHLLSTSIWISGLESLFHRLSPQSSSGFRTTLGHLSICIVLQVTHLICCRGLPRPLRLPKAIVTFQLYLPNWGEYQLCLYSHFKYLISTSNATLAYSILFYGSASASLGSASSDQSPSVRYVGST